LATVPEALIREFSDRAYSEVRRREREASSNEIAKDRGRVALAVASRTGRRVGLDTATRMAMDADLSLEHDRTEPSSQPPEETSDELMRIVSETASIQYRLQFLGPNRSPAVDPDGGRAARLRGCSEGGAPALAAARDRLPSDRWQGPGGLRTGPRIGGARAHDSGFPRGLRRLLEGRNRP
jgi:hypothetical protein